MLSIEFVRAVESALAAVFVVAVFLFYDRDAFFGSAPVLEDLAAFVASLYAFAGLSPSLSALVRSCGGALLSMTALSASAFLLSCEFLPSFFV